MDNLEFIQLGEVERRQEENEGQQRERGRMGHTPETKTNFVILKEGIEMDETFILIFGFGSLFWFHQEHIAMRKTSI